MSRSLVLATLGVAFLSCFSLSARGADAETATHVEVEPIKVPLGNQGRLETIAMTREGHLVAAVTWLEKKAVRLGQSPVPVRAVTGNTGTSIGN